MLLGLALILIPTIATSALEYEIKWEEAMVTHREQHWTTEEPL